MAKLQLDTRKHSNVVHWVSGHDEVANEIAKLLFPDRWQSMGGFTLDFQIDSVATVTTTFCLTTEDGRAIAGVLKEHGVVADDDGKLDK